MKQYATKFHHFLHGGDYNPEQWLATPEIWDQDIEYMKLANCNTVSLGIFSWAFLEPAEGIYDFSVMDTVIEKLTKNGINIILATPSGAKPRWMAEKYPQTLRVNADLVRERYRERHNHCFTSPVYREKVQKINRMLAQRYGKNPNIILWHVSNEYSGECHCELCQAAFREWLRKKYDNDLEKLNQAWWTGFWSHRITDWAQIESPSALGDHVLAGHFLDWKRFVTDQTTDFLRHEIQPLREITPHIPVTTNMMGPEQELDYWTMRDAVDVISWDAYPKWHSDQGNVKIASDIAFAHDLHRCLLDKPFILIESTPSLTNWAEYCKLKKPGMHKASSLQAAAHGSDSVMYFQWRKGRGGCEKFHGAVIGHDGRPGGRVFNDVAEVGKTLGKLDWVLGSRTVSDVAMIFEFENKWVLGQVQGFQNADKKYNDTCQDHYRQLWKRGLNVDVVNSTAELSSYSVVIAPMLYLISEAGIENLRQYVQNGGILVATYMTGYVNENDLCYLGGFPGGSLKTVFGLQANEIDTLYPSERNTVMLDGQEYTAVDYCELIDPDTAQVLGTYTTDFFAGKPAVLKNRYGKGTAYYIGCRDDSALLDVVYGMILQAAGIHNQFAETIPDGVTLHTREDTENLYLFVENYSGQAVSVHLKGQFTELETGNIVPGALPLNGYDVKVLTRKK